MKKLIYSVLFLIIIISACNRPGNTIRMGELDNLIDTTDTEMNAASEKARESLQEFAEALEKSSSDLSNFTIKINYKNGKQIWLYNAIVMKSGDYMGEISDGTPGTQMNAEVITIDPASICDWMYLENRKLKGGYTIRVQYERMTAEEKKKFTDMNGILMQ